MALEHELAVYRSRLPFWLAANHEGQWVVIQGSFIIEEKFETYEAALGVGYHLCGLTPFLVKKIERVETPLYFSRDLGLDPWQSIETAPKDGRNILVWDGVDITRTKWVEHTADDAAYWSFVPWSSYWPTHWMPCPPPPKETT